MDAGNADYAEYQHLSRRARAVAALGFALDEDARAGAPEALYEAYQALDQNDARLNTMIAQNRADHASRGHRWGRRYRRALFLGLIETGD